MKKQMISAAQLLLTAFIWGVAFVAQSVGMEYIGPYTFIFARNIIGGLVLLPLIYLLGKMDTTQREEEDKKSYKKNTILGGISCGCFLCAASCFQQFGMLHTSVGKAGFITALYIILVPILGIFAKKHVSARVWISSGIALFGFYLLSISGQVSINQGDLLVLAGAVLFSFHILTIDHFSPRGNSVAISCIQFFTASLISGFLMCIFEQPRLSDMLAAYLPILYAGVMSNGVAYTLQIVGQKHMEPTVASLLLSLESVFAALAGWVILGQVLTIRELLGCIFVFAAVLLAQLPSKKKKI